MQEQLLAEEVIPQLITDDINALLTMLPSHKEIKASSFALIKDSALVLEGFGTIFYQFLWDIVKEDVFKVVLQFFFLPLVGFFLVITQTLLLYCLNPPMPHLFIDIDQFPWPISNSKLSQR